MRIRRFLLRALAVLPGMAVPLAANAQITNPCPIPGILCITGGFDGLTVFAATVVFPALRLAFVALAILMFFYYSVRLLLESEEESTVTDTKNAYSQAIAGAAFVSICTLIVDTFGRSAAVTLVNPDPFEFGLGNIIAYMRLMVSIAATALIVFQAFRLIILQGQESEVEAQRKKFFQSLLGVGIILLASPIVAAIVPGANSGIAAVEIVGIINFLLEIVAAAAVVMIIVAGIYLVLSTDEEGHQKAKRIIFTTIISLIVVMTSFLIVNYVMFL